MPAALLVEHVELGAEQRLLREVKLDLALWRVILGLRAALLALLLRSCLAHGQPHPLLEGGLAILLYRFLLLLGASLLYWYGCTLLVLGIAILGGRRFLPVIFLLGFELQLSG
jgi:hypothetical protein